MRAQFFIIILILMIWTTVRGDSKITKNNELLDSSANTKTKFYTYKNVKNELNKLVNHYSSISKLDTIGHSALDNPILMLRISGNNNTNSKQRFFLSGAMHGNEKMGTETIIAISKHLLFQYESNTSIKEIVDRSEILLVPILNPDGYIRHKRRLESGDDPNRSFGLQLTYDGSSNIVIPFKSNELRAYRKILMESPWYASFDYHSGIVGLITPWMCSSNLLPDKNEYDKLTKVYNLYSEYDLDISRHIQGESVDYPYSKYGTMSFLPEIHLSQYSEPPDDYNQNIKSSIQSFLDVVDEMQKGITGKIIDARNGKPIFARIEIKNKGASVYSDYSSGTYFKYISAPSGYYEVTAYANGYEKKTVLVEANSKGFTTANFELTFNPTSNYGAISIDAIRVSNDLSYSEYSSSLSKHDYIGFPLQCKEIGKAFITLDMGPSTIITDQDGYDFTVYSTNNDMYTVSIAYEIENIDLKNNIIGTGQGITSFDLKNFHLDSARYIQISCTKGSPMIDAVEAKPKKLKTPIIAINNKKTNSSLTESNNNIYNRNAIYRSYLFDREKLLNYIKEDTISTILDNNSVKSNTPSF